MPFSGRSVFPWKGAQCLPVSSGLSSVTWTQLSCHAAVHSPVLPTVTVTPVLFLEGEMQSELYCSMEDFAAPSVLPDIAEHRPAVLPAASASVWSPCCSLSPDLCLAWVMASPSQPLAGELVMCFLLNSGAD